MIRLVACACAMLCLAVSSLAACPVCDTPTGSQVRAGIFGDDFGTNVLVTLAPFMALALVVALLHYGVPRRRGRSEFHPHDAR